jgi:hypothetical protein
MIMARVGTILAKFAFWAFSEVAPGFVTVHTYLRCTTGRG